VPSLGRLAKIVLGVAISGACLVYLFWSVDPRDVLARLATTSWIFLTISLALNLSPNPFAAMEIMTWLLGSLENRSMAHVWIALPCIAVGLALLLYDGRALDALTLGEDGARSDKGGC